jgi:hypothetical protein
MALSIASNMRVTVGDRDIWAVPGDVLVDSPDGNRRLLHKIQFEEFMDHCEWVVSGDRGFGWVICRKVLH